jgi:predicted MFS family arabinose efflux permease
MLAASLGQWMQSTALGWLALELTDSESFVGFVAFMAGLPFLLVSAPAGIIIDRLDRRKVLLACQALAAITSIVVAIDVLSGYVQPWHLPIAGFVNGSLQAIMNPTQQSIVPSLVPRDRMTNAIGLMGAGQNMTRIVGPTIAGAVIGFSGTGQAFLLQAGALGIGLSLLLTASFPERLRSTASVTTFASLFEGATTVRRRPDLRFLFLLVSIPTLFVFPYMSFLSVFARDILEIGPQGMGWLMAASGFGAVMGSLFVASRSSAPKVRTLVLQTVAYSVAVVIFAVSGSLVVALAMLASAGFLGSSFFSANTAQIQLRIDDSIRGRVMGIYMLTWGLMPLGAIPMGYASVRFGAPTAVAAGGIIAALGTLALYARSGRSEDVSNANVSASADSSA